MKLHLSPEGKPAPPRPRSPLFFIWSTIQSEPLTTMSLVRYQSPRFSAPCSSGSGSHRSQRRHVSGEQPTLPPRVTGAQLFRRRRTRHPAMMGGSPHSCHAFSICPATASGNRCSTAPQTRRRSRRRRPPPHLDVGVVAAVDVGEDAVLVLQASKHGALHGRGRAEGPQAAAAGGGGRGWQPGPLWRCPVRPTRSPPPPAPTKPAAATPAPCWCRAALCR